VTRRPRAAGPAARRAPDAPLARLGGGLAEAAARGVPIVCLAEPPWSNGAQRLALVLDAGRRDARLLERTFVPVLVDPIERPDVAARLRWAATALTGTFGPPLLVVLTPLGAPFLAYCSLWPEGGRRTRRWALLRSVAALGRSARRHGGGGARPRGAARRAAARACAGRR
jgi:hypothetical protein